MKESNSSPDFTILLINYNAIEVLKLQMPILSKLKLSYELIIIDNGSEDKSIEFLEKNYPDIKIIKLAKNEGTAAFNKGISHAKGKYILWIGDMIIHEESLMKLKETLERDSNIGIAVPYIINHFDHNDEQFKGELLSRTMYSKTTDKEPNEKNLIEITGTGVGLISKQALKDVGDIIYDNDYFLYGEDIDLGIRNRIAGKRAVIVKDAPIYHAHLPITAKAFSKRHLKFLTERNLTTTFLRTFTWYRTLLYLPYHALTRILASLNDIRRLDWSALIGRNQALLWLLVHPEWILRKRKFTQSLRKVSDKFLLKGFSEKAILP